MSTGTPFSFRSMLQTVSSPQSAPDYMVSLAGSVTWREAVITVHYVPDRLILEEQAWGNYLSALGSSVWETLEALALHILNDLNNELVPRWVRVTGSVQFAGLSSTILHSTLVEDHQPQWDNTALIDRVRD